MDNIKINIDNYEVFALDYLEDNLSEAQRRSFEHFLIAHPEIAEDMEGLLDFQLTRPALNFEAKQSLYKKNSHRAYRFTIFSIAASILLVAAFFFLLKDRDSSTPEVAIERTELKQTTSEEEKTIEIAQNGASEESTIPSSIDHHGEAAEKNIRKEENSEEYSIENVKTSETVPMAANTTDNEIKKAATSEKTKHNTTYLADADQDRGRTQKNNPTPDYPDKSERVLIASLSESEAEEINPSLKKVKLLPVQSEAQPIALHKTQKSEDQWAKQLANRIPDITIDESGKDDIIASHNANEQIEKKKKKIFRFRNLIPEQFAGITKEDVKRSVIPEALISR